MTDLNITQQLRENRELLLTIEVPDGRVEKAMRAKAKKLAKQLRIPGFRPGKAPYHVVVNRIGRETMLNEVVEDIADEIYKEALEALEIAPSAPAEITEITFDPLICHMVVPLPPEADPGDYRSLRVPFNAPDAQTIDESVQKEIDAIREKHKTWEKVDRPVDYGDLITIDLKAASTVDGEVVMDNEDWDIMPDNEDPTLAPEFDAAFIGMVDGDEKTFIVDFPEDSEGPWPGEQIQFEVKVRGVQGEVTPELNDEMAQGVGDGSYKTAEGLMSVLRENVQRFFTNEAEQEHRIKTFDALLELATISYPPAALEQETDTFVSEQEDYLKAYGIESTEEFLRIQEKSEDEYREELRPEAAKRLERRLVLDAIAEREQFQVSEYELRQFLAPCK